MVSGEKDVFGLLSAETEEQASRHFFEYTDCGAWIQFDSAGVKIGSIVEGCDFGTTVYKLDYPFEQSLLDRCVAAIEAEADALWTWANETDRGTDAPDVELDYLDLLPYQDGRSS